MTLRRMIKPLCAGALLAATVVALPGCGALLLGGAAGGVLVATDRRTVGAQTEDREIQIKAETTLAKNLPDEAHVNVTSFNRRVLLTGEVPDDATRQKADDLVKDINNVHSVADEMVVSGASSFTNRSYDTWITSKVKASMIEAKDVSTNIYKVVTERRVVYLMGLVTRDEGDRGADIASRVPGVEKVVKVFEYIEPTEAKSLSDQAAKSPQAPQPDETATPSAVPMGDVTGRPLSTGPAPISEAPVITPPAKAK